MILASHQPDFAPYPGFFYKMLRSDVFILSDDVAYSNSEMHKYNFIYDKQAGKKRISLPVVAHSDGTPLKNVQIADDSRLIDKIAKSIEQTYSKHPFYNEHGRAIINIILSAKTDIGRSLTGVNACLIYYIADQFKMAWKIQTASGFKPQGRRDDRLIDLCQKTNCNVYLSGWGAAAYHQPKKYRMNDISLRYTDYEPIVYLQYGNKGDFVPNLSMIDYLMNCGNELPKEWR